MTQDTSLPDALAEADQTALRQALDTRTAEAARLRKVNAELILGRDALRADLRRTQSTLEGEQRQRQEVQARLDKAVLRLRELETQAVEHRAGLGQDMQQLATLEAEHSVQSAEIDQLRQTGQEMATRLDDTERWLQSILASRSYRLLAPLRRLRAAFGRRG